MPQLELRKVETEAPKGAVVAKKKGEQEEESWGGFGGKKGKKGGKKAPAPAAAAPTAEDEDKQETGTPKTEALNLPIGTLTALLSLGITSPLTTAEVPKAIESLQVKKKYFVDNQVRFLCALPQLSFADADFRLFLPFASSPGSRYQG